MNTYFHLGTFPRDDVEGAARLLVKYRAAGLTGPEFGEMFVLSVGDPDAIVVRADEIEAGRERTLARWQSEEAPAVTRLEPGEPVHETFEEKLARLTREAEAEIAKKDQP